MRIFDAANRLREGLDYHLARHNLLSSNLAQLDTPGYKPVDLERETTTANFEGKLQSAIATTNPAHLSGEHPRTAGGRVIEDPTVSAGADDNAVALDREAVKIATNNLRYDTLTHLTQSELSALVWAANDGRGG